MKLLETLKSFWRVCVCSILDVTKSQDYLQQSHHSSKHYLIESIYKLSPFCAQAAVPRGMILQKKMMTFRE